MKTFQEFLSENYKNLIGPQSREKREQYVDAVWEILQRSYALVGGIKGSGFSSKQDMIANIPFWKVYTKNGKVLAAAFYKDKNGRKAVAIATDGSEHAKKIVGDIFKESLKVAYGEKSGPALVKMMKDVPWETLKNFMLDPKTVEKLTGDKVITKIDPEKLSSEDHRLYDRFPELKPYFYQREIGNKLFLKAAMGTPNLPIK